MKLWDKGYDVNKEVESFTVGDDYLLDQRLVFWDCVASIAHAMMLKKIGIISEKEFIDLKKGLTEIMELDKKGKFIIKKEQEDCHTAIEEYLTKKFGDAGKKIHTARSRNDQVLAALKLYMKKELLEIHVLCLETCNVYMGFTKENNIPMPGYTHMQKAMPSSTSLWITAFAESMLDNAKLIKIAFEIIDSCPLGSAAGYGVSLDIDRQLVSNLLGFSKVQNNVLYVQNSRGKNESLVLSAMLQIMLDLNKVATDLILFSMPEFGYFELPKEFCTGSSIMPQKKNPDVLELIRAKSKVVESLYFQVIGIIQNLPSGYNRDFQLTKKPLIEGIEITKSSLTIIKEIFKNLKVNEDNCRKAMTKELFAADAAYEYVKRGIPFREAYKKVAGELDKIKIDAGSSVQDTAKIDSNELQKQVLQEMKYVNQKKQKFEEIVSKLGSEYA